MAKWVRHLPVVSRDGSNPTPKDFSKMIHVVNSQLAKAQKRGTAVKTSPGFKIKGKQCHFRHSSTPPKFLIHTFTMAAIIGV